MVATTVPTTIAAAWAGVSLTRCWLCKPKSEELVCGEPEVMLWVAAAADPKMEEARAAPDTVADARADWAADITADAEATSACSKLKLELNLNTSLLDADDTLAIDKFAKKIAVVSFRISISLMEV